MAFTPEVRDYVGHYVDSHMGNDAFYGGYFAFISDAELRKRLEDEFRSARYIYKMLEGVQAEGWKLNAQVRIQILLYASIYEAVLHHVLLSDYKDSSEVAKLMTYRHLKPININQELMGQIREKYSPDNEVKVFQVHTESQQDERKILFEDKAKTAQELGLIDEPMYTVVTEVYSLRNAIHLHAELRREITYHLDKSKEAYWKLQGFCHQIAARMKADGKYAGDLANNGAV